METAADCLVVGVSEDDVITEPAIQGNRESRHGCDKHMITRNTDAADLRDYHSM